MFKSLADLKPFLDEEEEELLHPHFIANGTGDPSPQCWRMMKKTTSCAVAKSAQFITKYPIRSPRIAADDLIVELGVFHGGGGTKWFSNALVCVRLLLDGKKRNNMAIEAC